MESTNVAKTKNAGMQALKGGAKDCGQLLSLSSHKRDDKLKRPKENTRMQWYGWSMQTADFSEPAVPLHSSSGPVSDPWAHDVTDHSA